MMKYKVGDKVRVRKDIKEHETYGSYLTCNDSMVKKAGLVVTIKECDNVYSRYKIDADDWNWDDEMFEGLAGDEQTEPLLQEVSLGKFYTWQDLCDYETLLHERWRIANEQLNEQGQESVMHTLRQEYADAIERVMAKLGRDVPVSKAKELGFEV